VVGLKCVVFSLTVKTRRTVNAIFWHASAKWLKGVKTCGVLLGQNQSKNGANISLKVEYKSSFVLWLVFDRYVSLLFWKPITEQEIFWLLQSQIFSLSTRKKKIIGLRSKRFEIECLQMRMRRMNRYWTEVLLIYEP